VPLLSSQCDTALNTAVLALAVPVPVAVLRIRDVLSRIPYFFIPDPGGEKAPDPGSRILLYIKIGMKNKTNFFLAFYSFKSKFY
jgi:hypothetical protein